MLQQAQDLMQAGRVPEAAGLYHQVLKTDPRHFEALNALGTIYFHNGQFEQAQYLLGEALKLDPLHVEGLCLRGIALIRMSRLKDAIAAFDRALSIRPDFPEAIINRATAMMELRRFDDALAGFDAALALNPNDVVGWNNRGNVFLVTDRFDEAIENYDRALALNPGFFEARDNRRKAMSEAARQNKGAGVARNLCARGVAYLQGKRYSEALACFDEALSVQPDSVEAYSNRGAALASMGRAEEALASFDVALSIDPNHAISWNNRGNALASLKRLDEALEHYDKALALAPDSREAADNRMNALFELKRGTRCPPAYMRGLFDEFSSHYDETMLEKLEYRAHLHLRELANRVLPGDAKALKILDLGSGTGLVGAAFKELSAGGRLDAIDISPKMIAVARSRGIYDNLTLGDLETMLAQPGILYDLVLAADTMIYLGDLGTAFHGVAGRLNPGGFYLFAVEAKDGEGWEQTPMNRFRHSEAYLRSEAAHAGLAFVEICNCDLRTEAGVPVNGFAVALRKEPT
ncbi:MAG TPA: tetratricopeptide repeat protein [Micropepsaceae bacterium]|nr:tetratricopeptide repeat protein [Micropepsaceae bacterium]